MENIFFLGYFRLSSDSFIKHVHLNIIFFILCRMLFLSIATGIAYICLINNPSKKSDVQTTLLKTLTLLSSQQPSVRESSSIPVHPSLLPCPLSASPSASHPPSVPLWTQPWFDTLILKTSNASPSSLSASQQHHVDRYFPMLEKSIYISLTGFTSCWQAELYFTKQYIKDKIP